MISLDYVYVKTYMLDSSEIATKCFFDNRFVGIQSCTFHPQLLFAALRNQGPTCSLFPKTQIRLGRKPFSVSAICFACLLISKILGEIVIANRLKNLGKPRAGRVGAQGREAGQVLAGLNAEIKVRRVDKHPLSFQRRRKHVAQVS